MSTDNLFGDMLPKASEAYLTVLNGKYEKAKKEAVEVAQLIRRAISEGKLSISIEKVLEGATEKELRSRGYTVKYESSRNEGYTSISWSKA